MKIRIAYGIVMMMTLAGAASAQTAAPGTPSGTAPGAGAQTLTPAQQANRTRIMGERDKCRSEAQGRGTKPGPAMKAAVMDCMAKVDPVAAKRMGCAQTARAQNLTGDDMKRSVRACVQSAG